MDMVIIGHFSKDIILIDGKAETAAGGGIYYAAFAAKAAGAGLLAITKLALEDTNLLGGFWEHCIRVLAIPCPRTTVMEDRFEAVSGYTRRSRVLSQAAPFSVSDIPILESAIYYLTPLAYGKTPEPMIAELAKRGKVALDVQGFLRYLEGDVLASRSWALKERALSSVHYLKADREEACLLTGRDKLQGILGLGAIGVDILSLFC
jgi:hypothetical protein